jgi:enoyl-CoA hydratase/carnithine racemase
MARPVSATYGTIQYDVAGDGVATITLNRPEVLNAFDRQMCEEIRDAWRRIKDDPDVRAVVVRAAGDRAFCSGLDTKKPYGQPADVWNHEDPGELLSPKWQQVWKPVVCAVHGICTAGAFYLVNESDIVICSDDATFFDSHVTYGLVSALEPVGLMRKIGLGETLRMALSGNDERVTAATAQRIGLVTEVVSRAALHDRAHAIAAAIARKPSAATQGTVRAIWESLDRPYRAAMQQGLIYTRLGNPLGAAEVAERGPDRPEPTLR